MRLTLSRLRRDETGSAMMTALLSTIVMLALGLALLSIVDTQASESGKERTRDRAFNLAESVLTNEGFVLGRNWPSSSGGGTLVSPVEYDCSAASAAVGSAVLGAAATAGTGTALLQTNLNNAYTDSAYSGATWQVNVCDDDGSSTVWNDTTLTNHTKNWDKNGNNLLWVRAQATVGTATRALAGLVRVRTTAAFPSKYGLVTGNVNEDLTATASSISNSTLVNAIGVNGLLTNNPPVLADPSYPSPSSGVTGLRCGLLNSTPSRTCITGTIAAVTGGVTNATNSSTLSSLVSSGAYAQFPGYSTADAETVGQLRAQAKTSGTYTTTSVGGSSTTSAPSCTITGTPSSSTVVFIETVGTGDQYCVIDVSTSKSYKALVIGSGRVIIRGSNTGTSAPLAYSATAATNLFTGVIYALNNQSTDLTSSSPTKELVRIDQGARVKGAVNADGKNAIVNIIPPDFYTAALDTTACASISGLLTLTACLTNLAGLSTATHLNTLANGGCLVTLPDVGCTVYLPGLPVSAFSSQLTTYGSGIHSDVATINAVTVRGASGIVPGTFKDLNLNP